MRTVRAAPQGRLESGGAAGAPRVSGWSALSQLHGFPGHERAPPQAEVVQSGSGGLCLNFNLGRGGPPLQEFSLQGPHSQPQGVHLWGGVSCGASG